MKKIVCVLILVIFYAGSYAQTSVWTNDYQNKAYDIFYRLSAIYFKLDNQKRYFAACAVEKSKIIFPKGFEGLSKDSIEAIAMRVGETCANEIGNIEIAKWSPALEAKLKEIILNNKRMQLFTNPVKNQLVDCYISKLKVTYPNGIELSMSDSVAEKIDEDCINFVLDNKK